MDIKSATQFVVSIENMRTKEDLELWCGDMGKKKLYLYIQKLAPEHWNRIRNPENSVRFNYQQMLTGYKIYQ